MNENRSRVRLVQQSPARVEGAAPARSSPVLNRTALRLLRHKHAEEQLRVNDGEVFLPQSIYQKIMEHLSSDTERELGGLLVGTEIQGDEGRPSILIQDALPARHTRSHQTRLNFTEETWAEFNRELDALEARGIKLQRVGWYHSHPRMGIFLSPWDLDVCREFRRPTQVALVVDPCEPKGGFFVQGPKGFRDHAPQGFWEMKDLTSDSVVRWSGMTPGPELPESFLLGWTIPGNAVRPEGQARTNVVASTQQDVPLSSSNNRYKPPTPPPSNLRPSQWITAAAMLLAIIAVAAAWWIHGASKRDEALLASRTEELKWKSEEVDRLKAILNNTPPPVTTHGDQADQERAAQERAAQERAAQERAAQERAAQERAAQERTAQERVARERAAQERTAQERAAQERTAQERAAQERTAQERAAQERTAQERAAQERTAQERAAQERTAQERAAQERTAQERAAQERAAQERAAQERAAQERAAQERAAQDQAAQDQAAKDQVAEGREDKESEGKQKAAQEKEAQKQAEKERKERDKEAKRAEKERREKEKEEKKRAEKERKEKEKAEKEKADHPPNGPSGNGSQGGS